MARTNTSWERQAAEQHFTSVALRYESLRDTDHDALLLIRARLPHRPLLGVDIGAGTGRYTQLLRRVLPDRSWVLAADRSHAMLTNCGGGPRMALRCEAERLPLADGSVDFVTTFNAVHHFDLKPEYKPGNHEIVLTRGKATVTRTVELTAGGSALVTAVLAAAAPQR